jgi:hypothetical protein
MLFEFLLGTVLIRLATTTPNGCISDISSLDCHLPACGVPTSLEQADEDDVSLLQHNFHLHSSLNQLPLPLRFLMPPLSPDWLLQPNRSIVAEHAERFDSQIIPERLDSPGGVPADVGLRNLEAAERRSRELFDRNVDYKSLGIVLLSASLIVFAAVCVIGVGMMYCVYYGASRRDAGRRQRTTNATASLSHLLVAGPSTAALQQGQQSRQSFFVGCPRYLSY